jgi:hypothetical protein
MEHSANVKYPHMSPLWCNTAPETGTITPLYDGHYFYYWAPRHNYTVWFDTPVMQEELTSGNICYRLQGNVWFCPTVPELPAEVVPLPSNAHIKPSITVTTAKMENHAEHVSVLFGQVISNLK